MLLKGKFKHGSKLSSGFDIFANEDCFIPIGMRALLDTGVYLADDFIEQTVIRTELGTLAIEAQVRPKSGNSSRGIDVAWGTVDADYKDEILVTVINNTGEELYIKEGQKIAQIVFNQVIIPNDMAGEDARTGGHGSTGGDVEL